MILRDDEKVILERPALARGLDWGDFTGQASSVSQLF